MAVILSVAKVRSHALYFRIIVHHPTSQLWGYKTRKISKPWYCGGVQHLEDLLDQAGPFRLVGAKLGLAF